MYNNDFTAILLQYISKLPAKRLNILDITLIPEQNSKILPLIDHTCLLRWLSELHFSITIEWILHTDIIRNTLWKIKLFFINVSCIDLSYVKHATRERAWAWRCLTERCYCVSSLKTEENLQVAAEVPLGRLLLETDSPWCEVRPTHAGHKYVTTKYDNVKKKEKWTQGCMVKGRNEPCAIT